MLMACRIDHTFYGASELTAGTVLDALSPGIVGRVALGFRGVPRVDRASWIYLPYEGAHGTREAVKASARLQGAVWMEVV
jgi:hypothetical protein